MLRLWSAYIPCITKVSDDSHDAVLKQKRRSRASLPYTRRRSTKQSCRSIAACAPSSSVTPKPSELLFLVSSFLTRIKDGVGSQLKPTSPIAWLKHSSQAWCSGSVKSPSEPRERFPGSAGPDSWDGYIRSQFSPLVMATSITTSDFKTCNPKCVWISYHSRDTL